MEKRKLASYRGYMIIKQQERENGTIKKESILYRAYADGGKGGVCEVGTTLSGLKKKIDMRLRCGSPIAVSKAYIEQPRIRFGGGRLKWLDEPNCRKM